MFRWLSGFLQRRATTCLFVVVLLAGLAAIIAPGIRFDFTPQALFAGQDELVARAEAFKETFGHDDALVLLCLETVGPENAPGVLSPAALQWQRDVSAQLYELELIDGFTCMTEASVPIVVQPLPIRLGLQPLLPYGAIGPDEVHRLRTAMGQSKALRDQFVSADERLGVTYIWLPPESRTMDTMQAAIEALEAICREIPPPAGYRSAFGGLPALRVDVVRSLLGEQLRLMPITAALFVVLLFVMFRSLVWALLPLAVVGVGLVWTVALLVMTGSPFNLVTNILPLLLFILGTANAVHVVARYAEESARQPEDPRAAARETLEHLGLACLLTTLTTASGFLSLIVSETEVLRELAWQAAVGMGLIYVATMVLLGTTIWRVRGPWSGARGKPGAPPWLQRLLLGAAERVLRHPRKTVALSLGLIACALVSARGVHVNSSMLEMFDDDHPTSQLMRTIEKGLGGVLAIDVSLQTRGGEDSPLLSPQTCLRVRQIQTFAEAEPDVLKTQSYVDILDAIRTGPLGKAGGVEVPLAEATRADFTEALEAASLIADDIALTSYLTDTLDHARIQIRIRSTGTRETLALLTKLRTVLDAALPPNGPITATFTGDATVNALAMDSFVRDLFTSLLLASGLIFGLMVVLLRSVRAGLVAALPNLTPLILTVGYMGLRGYDMNAGNAIVFTISLGVAVDDTVHFLARAYEELQRGRSVDNAIRRAVLGAGRAMVLTTILLVVGLSVLALSDFVPNRRFCELTTLTMAGALIGDLLLLPACMKLFWRDGRG